MKLAILVLLGLLAFSTVAFAASECEESCCYATGGEWNSADETCEGASSSYYSCLSECEMGDTACCCGPMFLLMALVGVAALQRK